MFGVPREAVDPLMRRAAKTINFGVLYGMSAHRLSQELAIPYEEAQAFIERYFQSFPKVRAWIEKTLEEDRPIRGLQVAAKMQVTKTDRFYLLY